MRLVALGLVALLLAGCTEPTAPADQQPTSQPETTPPTVAADLAKGPAWSFTAIDGETYSRDAPAANATVLFFMATWCGTCRTKAPVIAGVVADYADAGVRTYSLDFDPSESADDLRAWQERYAQPWPHGVDPGLSTQRAFSVRSQSSVVVLDAGGNVVEHFGYGKVTDAGLRDALDRALSADA